MAASNPSLAGIGVYAEMTLTGKLNDELKLLAVATREREEL